MSRILFLDYEKLLEVPGVIESLTEQQAEVVTLSGYLQQHAHRMSDVPAILEILFLQEKFDLTIVSAKHEALKRILPEERDKVVVVLEENPTHRIQVEFLKMGYRRILSVRNITRHLTQHGAMLPL